MHLNNKDITDESIVTIYAGKLLDFSIAGQVFRTCDLAKKPMTKIILIDLAKTYQIMDSGLAMLNILDKRTKHQVQVINLINYNPMIKGYLVDRFLTLNTKPMG